MAIVDRQTLHRAIDELPDESLEELKVLLAYLHHRQSHPGSAWFRTLYDLFQPVRAGTAHRTEEEINQALDEALDEARREQNA